MASLIPPLRRLLGRAWLRLARGLGALNGAVLLGAIYLLVVVPIGLLRRWRGGRPPGPAPRDFERPW